MRRYMIFFEREDGYLVEMIAEAKEFRDLEIRILSAMNTKLKVIDCYGVENKIKRINKSHFRSMIENFLSDKEIPFIIECYKTNKRVSIENHMMQDLEKRIQADPPERN